MKLPEKSPDLKKVLKQPITQELVNKARKLVRKANNEYMYWDDLKYQPMPEGIAPEMVWGLLKMSRFTQIRNITLTDSKGIQFGYWLPDCVLSVEFQLYTPPHFQFYSPLFLC